MALLELAQRGRVRLAMLRVRGQSASGGALADLGHDSASSAKWPTQYQGSTSGRALHYSALPYTTVQAQCSKVEVC